MYITNQVAEQLTETRLLVKKACFLHTWQRAKILRPFESAISA